MSFAVSLMDFLTRQLNDNNARNYQENRAEDDITFGGGGNGRTNNTTNSERVSLHPPPPPVITDNDGEPRMDVFRNDLEYVVFVDLPGVPAEALDVRTRGRAVCVSGSRPHPVVPGGGSLLRMCNTPPERRYGRFARCFMPHADANLEDVEAHFRDGLLCLRLKRANYAALARERRRRLFADDEEETNNGGEDTESTPEAAENRADRRVTISSGNIPVQTTLPSADERRRRRDAPAMRRRTRAPSLI